MKKSSIALVMEYLEKTPNHKASLDDIEKPFGRIIEEKISRGGEMLIEKW
jgi:hypothetical protein